MIEGGRSFDFSCFFFRGMCSMNAQARLSNSIAYRETHTHTHTHTHTQYVVVQKLTRQERKAGRKAGVGGREEETAAHAHTQKHRDVHREESGAGGELSRSRGGGPGGG